MWVGLGLKDSAKDSCSWKNATNEKFLNLSLYQEKHRDLPDYFHPYCYTESTRVDLLHGERQNYIGHLQPASTQHVTNRPGVAAVILYGLYRSADNPPV